MKTLIALVFAAVTCACAAQAPRPRPSGPPLTGACMRSFLTTLRAWEAQFGRAPTECTLLDARYRVNLVSARELASAGCDCACSASGELVGCTTQPDREIYLLESRTNIELVDTSAHEWIHAIEQCAHGDMDVGHARSKLWERNDGAASVEIQAQASSQIGECL